MKFLLKFLFWICAKEIEQLADYGCSLDSYYIVMEYYPMTLKNWRKTFNGENPGQLLKLYREFLRAATILPERKINHFDIKCDNVMIDKSGIPALADFGESLCYHNDKNCCTLLNKGTEWIKSPEMLSIALNSSATNPDFDRRRKIGAGPSSDIWSIGCLFYELITGDYLFVDSDWGRFFVRITDKNQPLLREEDIQKLPNEPRYRQFIEFVLKRSVRHRPDLSQVIAKFDDLFPEAADYPLPLVSTH